VKDGLEQNGEETVVYASLPGFHRPELPVSRDAVFSPPLRCVEFCGSAQKSFARRL
jgi:hypothetical protein